MLATCICLNGSLLDQLSCTIVNLFTCTFGRSNKYVCLSVCLSKEAYEYDDISFRHRYRTIRYLHKSSISKH